MKKGMIGTQMWILLIILAVIFLLVMGLWISGGLGSKMTSLFTRLFNFG